MGDIKTDDAAGVAPRPVAKGEAAKIPATKTATKGEAAIAPISTPTVSAGAETDPADEFDFIRDVGLFARVLWRVKGGKHVTLIFLGAVAATVGSIYGQVRLNAWNGAFFDALGQKNLATFTQLLWVFLAIIAVVLALTVTQTFLQERLKFRLREWISRHLLAEWLKPMRVYQLSFGGPDGRNPDQRIQEDTRLLGDYSAMLGVGLVNAAMQMVFFIGVLWSLSEQVTVTLLGHELTIPGFMVWCCLAYAILGSGLTWLVGRPLLGLNAERYGHEAEFRFSLVRVNESGESIALHGGEKDEHHSLEGALAAVIDTMRRLSTSMARLTWITAGTGLLLMVIPVLVAAPAYFGGDMTLGGLMMVVGAFTQVQWAMRWFVDNFSVIADWRAALHRVGRFREALDNLPAVEEGAEEINREPHPDGHLTFEGVRILLPDGDIIIDEASVKVLPGERVLIVGEAGSGKSTLFRAVAGLWPWGSGTILIPATNASAFLPQRPYLPRGKLRDAVTYPGPAKDFSDDQVKEALERVNLAELAAKLDDVERWDRELSLGEQQRLAFARLLLHKPKWVFLDEATAALDEANQGLIMGLFDAELKDSTVLSIGHRPDLAAYHTRSLQLVYGQDGARLKLKQPVRRERHPPRRWLKRFRKAEAGR